MQLTQEKRFEYLTEGLRKIRIEKQADIAKLTPPPEYIAYKYFYSMDIDGKPIFDTLHDMYTNRKSFPDFMETAYDWIRKNEPELRENIAAAEK